MFVSLLLGTTNSNFAMSSSRTDVKQLVNFQILLNIDKIILFSIHYVVILLSKVCWFTASIACYNLKLIKGSTVAQW